MLRITPMLGGPGEAGASTAAVKACRRDGTRPLRMQALGRSSGDRDRLRIQRSLWVRALCDRLVWRRACWFGLAAGGIEVAILAADPTLETTMRGVGLLHLLITPALTLVAAALSAASVQVRAQWQRLEPSRN